MNTVLWKRREFVVLLPDLTMSPSPCKSTKEAEQKARKTDIMESSALSFSVGLNCLGNPWPSGEAILSETFRRRQATKNYCWNSSSLSDLEAFGNTYIFMYKRKWIFSFLEISHLSRSINGMYHFGLHAQTLTLPVCWEGEERQTLASVRASFTSYPGTFTFEQGEDM